MSSEGSEARQRWIARGVDFTLIVIGALVLMLPSLRDGAPAGQDYPVHLAWTRAFTDQLAAGELYPRWLQGMWLGAGGSDFFFYGPLPYWLMGTIKIGFCPNCDADRLLVIAGVILLTVSGLGFRFLAGQFSGRWAAIAAALIYMALPYHLSAEWYARLALAEFTAVAILPWHMAAFLDCLNCGRRGPHLAVLTALILLAHLPTAIIVAAADLTLLLALRIRCDRRTIAVARS